MKKFLPTVLCAILAPLVTTAQTDDEFRKAFDDFRKQTVKDFRDFRQKANAEYADFLEKAWEDFRAMPAVEKPEEKLIPPVKLSPKDNEKPLDDSPIKIKDLIAPPPPLPRPEPISPVNPIEDEAPIKIETPRPEEPKPTPIQDEPKPEISPVPKKPEPPTPPVKTGQTLTVSLYGTDMTVRVSDDMRFNVNANEKDVARVWKKLSGRVADNTLYDCLELRTRYRLSDWAYLRMLDAISDEFFGKDTNEAELLKAFLYCQSGYRMRPAFSGSRLVMLYGSPYTIYGKIWWGVDGEKYYSDYDGLSNLSICRTAFPGEKSMSTAVTTEQKFCDRQSPPRDLVSRRGVSVKSEVNTNFIEFCNDFPTSQYGNSPMTRWAIYANTPTSVEMKEKLYPQLQKSIEGLSDYEAVNRLCNWVQTAFVYEYDDKVWGADRAFFADETLYYPYCDCEDRSILLTRIVRDLLHLKCALVYYPGHLATAIALGEDAKGDYIRVGEEKFLVCDPTYINASIGRTMPGMDNRGADVMILE